VEEAVVAALVSKFALRIAVLADVFAPSVVLRVLRAFPICTGMLSKLVTVVEVMALLFIVMCVSLLMVVVVKCLILVEAVSANHGGCVMRLTVVVVECFMLVVPVSANRGGAVNDSMDVDSDEASA